MALVVLALAAVAIVLGAASCDKNQPDIPSRDPLPCQSHVGLDGRWYDSDGEVVDEDPCDGFDLDNGSHRTSSPKAPPKPVNTPAQPAPKGTKR